MQPFPSFSLLFSPFFLLPFPLFPLPFLLSLGPAGQLQQPARQQRLRQQLRLLPPPAAGASPREVHPFSKFHSCGKPLWQAHWGKNCGHWPHRTPNSESLRLEAGENLPSLPSLFLPPSPPPPPPFPFLSFPGPGSFSLQRYKKSLFRKPQKPHLGGTFWSPS